MNKVFDKLASIWAQSDHELYLVGGAVRDHVMGRENDDLDFTTDSLPQETIKMLEAYKLPVFTIGIEQGTVGTTVDGQKVEITTYRCKESYTKGNRTPTVVFGTSLTEDLRRRDFTINAMAMDAEGSIVDPFGGQSDIRSGVIKAPMNAVELFQDDPLRLMRGVRFAARYGFSIETNTFAAMRLCADLVSTVSVERVFQEMDKILVGANPDVALELMESTGLLSVLFPELQTVVEFLEQQGKHHSKLVWPHIKEVVAATPPRSTVRWAALYHDVAKPQTFSVSNGEVHFYGHENLGAKMWRERAAKLHLSTQFTDDVELLVSEHMVPYALSVDGVSDKPLRQMVARVGHLVEDLLDLNRADLGSKNPQKRAAKQATHNKFRERVYAVVEDMSRVVPKLPKGFGDVLFEMGVERGPRMGRIMSELTAMLVSGELTQETLMDKAKELVCA